MPSSKEGEIRCICSRAPLLAKFGVTDGRAWVHLRVYKQKRVYGEMVATGGEVRILCRECLRWLRVILSGRVVKVQESVASPSLTDEQESNR